ncbi:oxysterol-binding protein [Saccharomycopsis crataegensis]|uniref:Oxysterol-binding protein n=1 Tax=Saccharomycopsis crataegensis TaxID=43959 RepID=A0AAV5QHD4_9ASCO|nr:oxysterol-binding protein [Saccharomycopsis crataegensis]
MSGNSASWKDFLKSIASFNGDLYTLTAPPFILSPVSLVEYSQFWCEHPELFLAPNFIGGKDAKDESTLLERQIAVTKWFIATLRSQYASRNETLGTEKKPLNPFLGEVFVGKWEDSSKEKKLGDTVLLSEQVSHHPPVTAYSIINEKNNTYLSGYNEVKTQIYATSLTLNVKQYGNAILEYRDLNENYLVTLPGLHIEGLLMASPYVELDGKSYIQSSSGYITVIEFSGKGWVSGKKNSFKAKIFKDKKSMDKKGTPECTISGQWSGSSSIYYGDKYKKTTPFYDAATSSPEHLKVKPISEQHSLESRKAWKDVAEAIKEGSFEKISESKSKLENAQREKRKQETDTNSPWKVRWFKEVDDSTIPALGQKSDQPFLNLCEIGGFSKYNVPSGTFNSDAKSKTAVHWRFNDEAFKNEKEIVI